MKKLLALLILIPNVALAQVIPVDIKFIAGKGSFDLTGAVSTVRQSLRFINRQKLGVRLRVKSVEEHAPTSWSSISMSWDDRKRQAAEARKLWGKKGRIQVVVLEPVNGTHTGGVASPSPCSWEVGDYPVVIANITPRNILGQDRTRHAQVTVIHEIGHVIGASHDSSSPVSIMHDAPLQFVDANKLVWEFNSWSRDEIRRCTKRSGLN